MSKDENLKFKKCPKCGYEVREVAGFRCPRCNAIILKKCAECRGCSLFNPGQCDQ